MTPDESPQTPAPDLAPLVPEPPTPAELRSLSAAIARDRELLARRAEWRPTTAEDESRPMLGKEGVTVKGDLISGSGETGSQAEELTWVSHNICINGEPGLEDVPTRNRRLA